MLELYKLQNRNKRNDAATEIRDLLRICKPLFFLIIQEAVAVALKIRVLDLVAELLAHAFIFLAPLQTAGAVAARPRKVIVFFSNYDTLSMSKLRKALLDAGDDLRVLVQTYFHSSASSSARSAC